VLIAYEAINLLFLSLESLKDVITIDISGLALNLYLGLFSLVLMYYAY